MATITISVKSTVIDTVGDTDATIQTALRTVGGFAGADVSIIPISNTKARVIMVYY